MNQSGCTAIEGVDDAAEMRRTRTAMGKVGLADEDILSVTRTLAAVLLLAQLQFESGTETDADDDSASRIAPDSSETLSHTPPPWALSNRTSSPAR